MNNGVFDTASKNLRFIGYKGKVFLIIQEFIIKISQKSYEAVIAGQISYEKFS